MLFHGEVMDLFGIKPYFIIIASLLRQTGFGKLGTPIVVVG